MPVVTAPIAGELVVDVHLGRENGREGLEEYYQTKSIWYDYAGEVGDSFSLDVE